MISKNFFWSVIHNKIPLSTLSKNYNSLKRVLGASTKIVDKWDEIAYLRDVTIAAKDVEIEETNKILDETKAKDWDFERNDNH